MTAELNDYRPVSNIPFGGKILKCSGALQLLVFLENKVNLDPEVLHRIF